MSLVLLDATATDEGITATFATEQGVESLTGTHAEIARLAEVMKQVATIAPMNDTGRVWLEQVVVGDALIKLGLGPGGAARIAIYRRHPADSSARPGS
jgi:hypothetical protein